uniref:Uncharacterized protein n=1 Tax=Cacopsylla melanoneura TaxID=428564 RepID=A0A8D8REW2_9HEMI
MIGHIQVNLEITVIEEFVVQRKLNPVLLDTVPGQVSKKVNLMYIDNLIHISQLNGQIIVVHTDPIRSVHIRVQCKTDHIMSTQVDTAKVVGRIAFVRRLVDFKIEERTIQSDKRCLQRYLHIKIIPRHKLVVNIQHKRLIIDRNINIRAHIQIIGRQLMLKIDKQVVIAILRLTVSTQVSLVTEIVLNKQTNRLEYVRMNFKHILVDRFVLKLERKLYGIVRVRNM